MQKHIWELYRRGEHKEILDFLKDQEINKENEAYMLSERGRALNNLDAYQEALDYLHKANDLEKNANAETLYRIAYAYYWLRDYSKASKYIDRVLHINNHHLKANDLLDCIVQKYSYTGKRYIPSSSNNLKFLEINSPWGELVLKNQYHWTAKSKDISISVDVNLHKYNPQEVKQFIQILEKNLFQVQKSLSDICQKIITEVPNNSYYSMEEVYFFKYNKPFDLKTYQKNMILKQLTLSYATNNISVLKKISLGLSSDEQFSFGALHQIDDIHPINNFTDFECGHQMMSYLDFDYHACIKVLEEENEPKFSEYCINSLAFMEGVTHQGDIYRTSAEATQLLIPCVMTCNLKMQELVLELLCTLKEAAQYKMEGKEKEFGKDVIEVFKTHQSVIKSWGLSNQYPKLITFLTTYE